MPLIKLKAKKKKYIQEVKYGLLIEEKKASPFVAGNLCTVMAVKLKKYLRVFPTSCFHFKKTDMFWCADLEKWDIAAEEITNNVIKNPDKYKKLNTELLADIKDLKKFSKKYYFNDFSSLSNKSLKNIFLSGLKKYENVYERGIIPTIADLHKPFLSEAMKNKLSSTLNSDINTQFTTLTTPIIKSDIQIEEKKLLELAISEKSKEYANQLKKHVKNYFWLTFGYSGPEYSIETAIARIKLARKNKKNTKKRLAQLNYWENDTKERINNCLKKLSLNNSLKRSFQIVREWIYLKGARKEAFFMCYALFDKIAQEFSSRFNIEKQKINFLTKNEVLKLLNDKKIPKDINERLRESMYVYLNNEVVAFSGKKALDFKNKKILVINQKHEDILIGQTAFPGIAKGRVKIVNEPKDMAKVQSGDILVSFQTNPNIIPAMGRASSFVTDMGGVTCHAAIVSREMKKPCVVGTKIATKVLHDGDLVEVDANKGIVRIIKKNKN